MPNKTTSAEMLTNAEANPFLRPHLSAPNIPKQEVTNAIAAVTSFLDLVGKK